MRKEGRVQNFVIALFGIAIVAMSVGFAAYATQLTIGGGASGANASKVTFKNAWDIHYVTPASITTGNTLGSITSQTATDVTFTATLNKPGDTFAFTMPVTNAGTIDAELKSITMSAYDSRYITYTIAYDGATYTGSNPSITGSTLLSGATKTMTVTVSYKQDANQSDLPTTEQTIDFYASLNFEDYSS